MAGAGWPPRRVGGRHAAAAAPPQQQPRRTVSTGDWRPFVLALVRGSSGAMEKGTCVMTSVPDASELAMQRGGRPPDAESYGRWLEEVVETTVGCLDTGAAAVFYQTDARLAEGDSYAYVDKAFHVVAGARAAGGRVLWHRIALKSKPGTASTGVNPHFTHVIAVEGPRGCALPPPRGERGAMADVLERGETDWKRGTDARIALHAVRFLRNECCATKIVDPFCGTGAVLAVSNLIGCDALGNDLSPKRTRIAQTLQASFEDGGRDICLSRPEAATPKAPEC